jgi:ligand-binding sensor domain-containing protein
MKPLGILFLLIMEVALQPLFAQALSLDSLPKQWEITNDYFARFTKYSPIDFDEIGIVNDIIQDRTGFIWLAGENGLGRFDGYEFKIYQPSESKNSLNGHIISSLLVDNKGDLWIGHSGGLVRYNRYDDNFVRVFGAYAPYGSYIDSSYVRALFMDTDSLIWFETLDGWLHTYNTIEQKHKKQLKHKAVDQPYYHYHAIARSSKEHLLVGGRAMGPYLYDETRNVFKPLPVNQADLQGFKRENDVSMLMPYKDNKTWIGGFDGLYLYDQNRDYFHKYYSGTVYSLISDKNGLYWLGTANGLLKINIKTGQAIHYQLDNNDPGSLGGERIYKVYEDRSGRLWFSHENGISTHLPQHEGISYMFHVPGIVNTPASSRISSLSKKSDNEVWIGTTDEGIDVLHLQSMKFEHFHPKNNNKILSAHIRSLKKHPDSTLYIGYWAGKGFGRFLPKSNTFESFRYDSSSLKQDWYNDFTFNNDGNVYLGFWGGPGLMLFQHQKAAFDKILSHKLPDSQAKLITVLHFAPNKLWIGTSNRGLICYNTDQDTAVSYFTESNPNGGIDADLIYDITTDSRGTVWVAANGLFRYDTQNDRFEKITTSSHFQQMQIFKIGVGSQNNLWLLSSKGLMKYDPQLNLVTDYSMLVNITYNAHQAAFLLLDESKILLGGRNGLAMIETDKMGFQHRFPKVFLTHLDVFNEVFIPFIDHSKKVRLVYHQNFFAINFGTDRWESNNLYTFYYKLEGFDDDWRSLTSQQRSVYFTNVPAGSYIFKMRIGDAYGNMGEQESHLQIEVAGPWWKRAWFIVFVSLMLISVLLMIWYARLKDVKLKLQNMELNQKLLRLQMNPHFIFNSLTSIQNYIYSNQKHLAGQYLSDFARLIRLILENSRHERINLDKEIETISLYMELQKLRFTDHFTFKVVVDPDIDTAITFVPPMMVQPFLENALEHGLKNKLEKGGEIQVKYTLMKNSLQYEVRDNGVGLSAAAQQSKLHEGESLSITICRERLQLIEKQSKIRINFVIEEIVQQGIVMGTRVVFTVPLTRNSK